MSATNEILSPDKLASPGLLFSRRAELQQAKAKGVQEVSDKLDDLRAIKRECDRLDTVIARHLEADPMRVVRTKARDGYVTVEYAVQLEDGQVTCRPCSEDYAMTRLTDAEVQAALAEHSRFLAGRGGKSRPRYTAAEIREAAMFEATQAVFGADAATEVFSDADDDDAAEVIRLPGREAVVRNGVGVTSQEAI
jgi:hypothetical protein